MEVLAPSPDRVEHFWDLGRFRALLVPPPPAGGRRRLGHISLERQRSLKAEVLAEQLRRLAGVDLAAAGGSGGEAVGDSGTAAGLTWRTRAGSP